MADNVVRKEQFTLRQQSMTIDRLVDRLINSGRIIPECRDELRSYLLANMNRETRRYGSDILFGLQVMAVGARLASEVLSSKTESK